MNEGIRERLVQGRQVVGTLDAIMKNRNALMEINQELPDSIELSTLTYGSETRIWNKVQQSKIRAVEMNHLRGAWGVIRWEKKVMRVNIVGTACLKGGRGMECGVAAVIWSC